MNHSSGVVVIEVERRVSTATVQLANFDWTRPIDAVFGEQEELRLDLCLTPRPPNARACFRNRWGPHRFEPIGEVFMVPSGEAMHARSDSGRQASVVCELRPHAVRQWFDGEVRWTNRRLEASLDITNANVRSLMLRLAEEARHPGFAGETLIELIVAQMAIELGRYCVAVTDSASVGGLAPWCLRLIDERLKEVRQAPTLAELARLCNLSVRQLTRGFRVSRNCSIGDHIENCRIAAAKRLLATDEGIKSIAYSMGFASPSSFAQAFRRGTGESPRDYRQRLGT